MTFLGLRVPPGGMKNIRGFRARPAMTPLRPSRPVPLRTAVERVVEEKPSKLKAEQKRRTATATERKTKPVEVGRPSGGRVGGRAPTKPTQVGDDRTVMVGPIILRGPQKNTTIMLNEYDEVDSPPPPITVEYEVEQTGSSKRLDEYKKMYRGSTYELDTPTLVVGGTGSNRAKKFRPSTMCGFGRKNVFWPYWLNDYYSPGSAQLTSKTACFTRTQVEDVLFKMWQASGISDSSLVEFIAKLENTVGGDVRVDFPLDYIECEYKYFNNNIAMPIDASLYICMPERDMVAKHSPMSDWFNPASADFEHDSELMLPSYYYEPTLSAEKDVMFTNSNGTITNIGIKANCQSILTAATEVVPEATPQGFSAKFRRNWNVLHVQHFQLQPQQELIVKFRVKLSKLLDMKQLFAYDNTGIKFEVFKDLTLFPMMTFQGQDTTAVSSKLQRSSTTDRNRFLETTAPRSSASMLSSSMTCKARVHTKTAPLRNFSSEYTYTIGDILDIFSVSKRELLPYDSLERGEQCPYYQVNDNIGYFCDKNLKPTAANNYFLSQLVTLAIKGSGFHVLPSDIEPTAPELRSIDTETNWAAVTVKTVSAASLEKTGSDISPA